MVLFLNIFLILKNHLKSITFKFFFIFFFKRKSERSPFIIDVIVIDSQIPKTPKYGINKIDIGILAALNIIEIADGVLVSDKPWKIPVEPISNAIISWLAERIAKYFAPKFIVSKSPGTKISNK